MCDSIVVTKEFTKNGVTIFGKASDRAVNEPQPFVYVPAADHQAGEKVKCTFIEVEQAPHTNAMILSKPSWIWGAEIGVNEFGVCIGNESIFSKELNSTQKALLGMDIVRLALERASTAREAVEVMGQMMERYGQGGNASFDTVFHYDNAYLVVDENEAWHVETAGMHFWAAKQVSGPYSISNYMSINYPDLMHKDLKQHAIDKGYPVDEPFDFAKAYVDWRSPVNQSGMMRRCCSYQMANKPGKTFVEEDMVAALRSHYANDPWTEGASCVCMHASNPPAPDDIACQTCNSMVALCRGKDSVMWGPGMAVTCIAPFQPFWMDAFSAKQVFAYDQQEAAMDEWIKREGINRAILDGRIPVDRYQEEMHGLESAWLARVQAVDASRESRQALCDQIADEAEAFFDRWLSYAKTAAPAPMGSEAFQAFWRRKNAELGQDRRIAY